MIAIVDYGAGNLFSVANALEHLSISYQIAQEPQALYESDGVLLPGVGAFPDAMAMLREKDLIPSAADGKEKAFSWHLPWVCRCCFAKGKNFA